MLRFSLDAPDTAQEVVQLLMSAPGSDRPDALYIDDDNFLEAAMTGILSAGTRVPEDLQVFAHTNLPWTPATPMPVQKIGFDARQTIRVCIDSLVEQRVKPHHHFVCELSPSFEGDIANEPQLIAVG